MSKKNKTPKLITRIIEYFNYKKKYNRILNQLELEEEKEERLIYQKNTYKRLSEEQQKIFNKNFKKYINENILLKEKIFIIYSILENNCNNPLKQIEEVLCDIDILKED